jgi:hypothetical protein
VAFLAAVVLAGCGGQGALRQTGPSPIEREWLGNWHATVVTAPVALDGKATRMRSAISSEADRLHLRILRLRIYGVGGDVVSLAVEAARPIPLLKDGLIPLLRAFGTAPRHLLVVNARDGRVLELWSDTHGDGGWRLEPGLSGCSALTDSRLGLPPSCPPEGVLGFEFG